MEHTVIVVPSGPTLGKPVLWVPVTITIMDTQKKTINKKEKITIR